MEITYILQLLLACSFLMVSVAFSIKLLVEAYLWWVEVKTGLTLALEEHIKDEEDIDG